MFHGNLDKLDVKNELCKDAVFICIINPALQPLSNIFQKLEGLNIEVDHIETRTSTSGEQDIGKDRETNLLVYTKKGPPTLLEELKKICTSVRQLNFRECETNGADVEMVPWFPRHISELDVVSNHVLMYGSDLDADHPGFKDEIYRKRRNEFADIAYNYKYGKPIPRIEYTASEKKTWAVVYRELMHLYETHACKEFLENLPLLQKHAGYREDDLPQLEDVSNFLKWKSGFVIRPVAGYISARDFLSGLAFRVFYCTQYIRHPSDPFYTPEPDCVHELMGHMPLLANPSFARFSQELGLASLGTTDEEVKKLATVYFFTVEFGICHQDGKLRAFGAGLLSSIGELKHALSNSAVKYPFVPHEVVKAECLVTTFQNAYYVTSNFEEAQDKMRHFAQIIKRPFAVHYNPYTQSVEVIDSPESVAAVLNTAKAELSIVDDALCQFAFSQKGRPTKVWKMLDPKPNEH